MAGRLLACCLFLATAALVVDGTLWPVPSAAAYAGRAQLLPSSSTPQAALENLGDGIRTQAWQRAYDGLANKAQFTESDFVHDLTGTYPGLLTYTTLQSYQMQPLHASAADAEFRLELHWSTVVGDSVAARDVHVVRNEGRWQVEWPISREPAVPPQVIPVNYLRWDVINRGAGDDWGAADVEAPHIRILDMHPVQRAAGAVILGELVNEDVVPAYVSVSATLLAGDRTIATEGSFDKMSHVLLPKQVTPFLIRFPDVQLSSVTSVRMTPFSTLVPASADPVIEIQDQHLNPAPDASLSGQLVNESGQIVNVAHVLGTFYDSSGQVVWVADQYVDRALLPQTPERFDIRIPEDLARKVTSERSVVATYRFGGTL